MPATQIPDAKFEGDTINVVTLLVTCGLCKSNGEARRLIQQGGVSVNERKVNGIEETFDRDDLRGNGLVIRKGKKVFHRAWTE